MVGCSMAFSFSKFQKSNQTRVDGTKYAAMRALKLYFLGVLLQVGSGLYRYGLYSCGLLVLAYNVMASVRCCKSVVAHRVMACIAMVF